MTPLTPDHCLHAEVHTAAVTRGTEWHREEEDKEGEMQSGQMEWGVVD